MDLPKCGTVRCAVRVNTEIPLLKKMMYEVDSIIDINQLIGKNFRDFIDERVNISAGVPLSTVYDRPWDDRTVNYSD